MKKQQSKTMLEWTTQKTISQFNGSYYEQTNGLARGAPIASLSADICDQHSELSDQHKDTASTYQVSSVQLVTRLDTL